MYIISTSQLGLIVGRKKSKFRIVLTPGSSYEDDFKTTLDPDWKIAWNERLKPHLDEFQVDGKAVGVPGFVKLLESDGETALYNEYFSVV